MRLLLVEDDRMIGETLRNALRLEHHAVDWVRDAASAAAALASERFDLVLLDLGLPATAAPNAPTHPAGGLDVLRRLRDRREQTPVIVLTARDGPGDKVAGLDAGADDYLVKPFDLDELGARIRAVQRRHAGRAETRIAFGGVTLDPATRQVTKGGVPVLLSAREFAVLEALMQRPGALLSRAQLEDRLYGWGEAIESNAVSVYVHQLRRKLGADFIGTVRGVGYFVGEKPRGGVKSLRLRLLVALLGMLAVAALVIGAATYRTVLAQAESLFDYQLRQMALSLRDQGEIAGSQASALADGQLDFVVQIWTVDGRSIYASRNHESLPERALLGFADLSVGGQTWRTFGVATSDRVIQVAQPLQTRRRLAADAALRSVAPLLLVTPMLALAVWWLAAMALGPLARVAAEVRERDEQSLRPLDAAGLPDEVAPLVQALNGLLHRLGASFDAQRAFVADAAHELRSPLTALKLQIQMVRRAPDEAARTAAVDALAAGIDRAVRGVEQLLSLARAEPGAPLALQEGVDLAEVARQALADTAAFAHARGTSLELIADGPVLLRAEPAGLAVLARNLADNAVRYSPPGARVEMRVDTAGGAPSLVVDDAGPGIAPADRERVFDRFHRQAAGDEPGSGLGLAIVRGIAARHGATVRLEGSPLGGLRVVVSFEATGPNAGLTSR